jgi:hypothetical protein
MRSGRTFALAIALAMACRWAAAADAAWTIAVIGGRELTVPVQQTLGEMPMVDVRLLARDLDLIVDQRDGQVVIRDRAGVEWQTTHGSVLLNGPISTRALGTPAVVAGGSVLLPLDCIADLAGRKVVLDGRRALLLPVDSVRSAEVRVPAGWQPVQIEKTPAELAETRRLEGDLASGVRPLAVKDVMPPAHETLTFDAGLGFAQGYSGAGDLVISGSASGVRLNLSTFLTYGRDGAIYRSGRLTVQDHDAEWLLEAGDLLSDIRGLARGIRVGGAPRTWWHPSIGLYIRSAALSPVDQSALVYRDDVQLPFDADIRAEAGSDGSSFVGLRWQHRRASVDTFSRNASSRLSRDHGGTLSYDVWNGITVQLGARLSSGAINERWYFAAVSVPVANKAVTTLERTRSGLTGADTSAVGLQIPIGRLRVMQRYQWNDVALVPDPALPLAGYRQLQSTASYSPMRRLQLSYQVATQWTASTTARQWTELQTVFTVSRATSLHAVTGLPDVANAQRFRIGLQQNLRRGFRLAVDYGRLPAFQSPVSNGAIDRPRWLVMVRRSFVQSTPAAGHDVRGHVVDPGGRPVAGAVVTLGPYVTTARADGSYRFAHVPGGELDLGLDDAHLPAQYASDGVRQQIRLVRDRDVETDLHAIPLHAIHGHVYIDRNGNGVFDPGEGVPNVVVRLSSGESATMTDKDGAYSFYNLLPNHYEVRVDQERLSRDLAVFGVGSIDVQMDGVGRAQTGIDFRVAPKDRPIIMQKSLPQ